MKVVKTIASIMGIFTVVTCALAAICIFLDNNESAADEIEID